MINITYVEDSRRPERNEEFKAIIKKSDFADNVEYTSSIDIKYYQQLETNGIVCHSGMDGFNIIKHFAKEKGWPILTYSGSSDCLPTMKKNPFAKHYFSVHCDYFEKVLPEFIQYCSDKLEA